MVAANHAWFSYEYFNDGNVDGYASFFESDAMLHHPGLTVRGQEEPGCFQKERSRLCRHEVTDVIPLGMGSPVTCPTSATGWRRPSPRSSPCDLFSPYSQHVHTGSRSPAATRQVPKLMIFSVGTCFRLTWPASTSMARTASMSSGKEKPNISVERLVLLEHMNMEV
ncbi:nuclear transport factor 2 family protein [Streptosporangium sp. NBC_01756]|uniref:nuclear transport factor 2 family protein n=1 Tax=Streptosporangium sp. NBC_01756 TaxID=2975950 RepID=UPI002DD98E05|nr:nuclear transport factor 2 family protein [Streptosporangium sp. NBC_01756]WSC83909.1 nuclear transport factor 2 family protein [Streptosporangium sp. NBC_01756]